LGLAGGGFYRENKKNICKTKKTFAKQKRTLGKTNTKKIRIQINGTTARV
jgi:hypothetical protein